MLRGCKGGTVGCRACEEGKRGTEGCQRRAAGEFNERAMLQAGPLTPLTSARPHPETPTHLLSHL
jgi:hypothetical protein